jgi:YlmC/YmxH family sporulation protein
MVYANFIVRGGNDVRLCELEDKEVINTCDCKRLGYIADLIIDECKGCIEAVIVPKCGKFCGIFGDGKEYVIPFCCIKRIGPDVIIVELCDEK